MDDAAGWRVRVEFGSLAEKQRYLELWEESALAVNYAPPSGDGATAFYYVASESTAEELAAALSEEFPMLPLQVDVDRWIAEEGTWSSDATSSRASGWFGAALDALFGGVP